MPSSSLWMWYGHIRSDDQDLDAATGYIAGESGAKYSRTRKLALVDVVGTQVEHDHDQCQCTIPRFFSVAGFCNCMYRCTVLWTT